MKLMRAKPNEAFKKYPTLETHRKVAEIYSIDDQAMAQEI